MTEQDIHVTSKVIGSRCNYECEYCFYLEKDDILGKKPAKMPDEILESFIDKYISAQNNGVVEFVWHGGEPTLLGISYFKKIVTLQNKHKNNKTIRNTIQTNGSKIDEEWCRFFYDNKFLVGLSLDGPQHIHDMYRTRGGQGTFSEVMAALSLLKKYNVDYNILACVPESYTVHAKEIYNFFKSIGIKHIQFSPVVEYKASKQERENGFHFSSEIIFTSNNLAPKTTDWSISGMSYGKFLCEIFDVWVRNDVGNIFVSNFENALTQHVGNPSPNCIHAKKCGKSLTVETNGDIYFCDHVTYPESKLGNIFSGSFYEMDSDLPELNKESQLSKRCKQCNYLHLCNGGCPKHRIFDSKTKEKENLLCEGYFNFYTHTDKYFKAITVLLVNGYPASHVMEAANGRPLMIYKNQ